ncbi:histidine kinase [Rhodococcus sp. G-MC3]|uniref:sensor histidine kinase n=1 Tax=Rhodococcus sp. G-MC3 TaxID=3046209 RepID=UPI0024BA51F4|nr:histidine kinase [Rhodococcus sp. G-MC3]MDJ0394026.1 histidine kinase [Rhodococcus sp. G-MC3]
MFRTLSRYQTAVDVGFAAVFTALLFGSGEQDGAVGVVLLFGFAVALALRRASPALALGVAWICAIGQMSASLGTQAGNLAILFVLFATAAYGSPLVRKLGLVSVVGGGIVAALFLTFVAGEPFVPDEIERTMGDYATQIGIILTGSWAVLGLSWALGRIAYANRVSVESKHRSELAEMEQTRALAEIAIEHERNRIARDMHDIVAHSLAVVIAQADGARYARAAEPESVEAALSTIASTARDALRDVRGVLAQLRHNGDDVPASQSQDLGTLVERMRTAGLHIDLKITGDPSTLGVGGQLTLFRIAQEALTNALRHGDSSQPVRVELTSESHQSTLRIRNRVRSDDADNPGGHGLIGMRERAVLSGGSLTAGQDEGVWTLVARIPVMGTAQ